MSKSLPERSLRAINDRRAVRLRRLRSLSHWLDSAIGIPGTKYRVGLDPLLGLLPGGGDTAGLLFSAYIVMEAARMGASKSTLGSMAVNILLDTLLGVVPIVGDLFDVAWKSNVKNIELLEEHLDLPHSLDRPRNHAFAVLLILGLALVFVASAILSVFLLQWLFHLVHKG
jgi:hypothetical protein